MALAQLFRGSFSNNEVQSMERFNSCWIVCWMFMVQITIHSDLLLVSGLHQLCRSLDWICGQEFLGKFTLNLVSMISFLYVTDLPSLILSCPIMFHYSSLILLAILPKLCYHNFSLPTSLFVLSCLQKREVNTILADIIKHMTPDRAYEDFYPQLKGIMVKVMTHMHDFSILFALVRLWFQMTKIKPLAIVIIHFGMLLHFFRTSFSLSLTSFKRILWKWMCVKSSLSLIWSRSCYFLEYYGIKQ